LEQPCRLAVSIADDAVQMVLVHPDGRLGVPRDWPRARFSTLTDTLLTFEREARQPLRGLACAIAIQGVTHGEAITLARGGWAISQAGLRSIFQREVVVINDVAARAWAVLGGQAGVTAALTPGLSAPDYRRFGRWAVSHVEKGVGLAVIDVDQRGASRVLECEMGHCVAVPTPGEEERLVQALAGPGGAPASWERVLTLPWDDPAWHADGLPPGRAARAALLGRLLGRYAGEVVLAHGAWGGVLLTGTRAGETAAEHAAAFNAGFEAKNRFPRLIRAASRWYVAGRDVTLAGLAVALDHHPAMRPV
jgi:glucokinase